MENHGTDFGRRWKVLRERVEAMKRIWTEEAAEYHGEFVHFDAIWQYPKPLQKPHPPVILGSASKQEPAARRRLLRRLGADRVRAAATCPATIRELHAKAEAAGRDPRSIELSLFWAPGDADALGRFADLGIARGILAVPSIDRDAVLRMLDEYAPLVRQVG